MKKRKYEKTTGIIILIIFLWITELILVAQLFNIKISKYNRMTLMMITDQEGVLLVEKKNKKAIYNNAYLYLNNKKINYKIIEEIKLDDKKHVEVHIKLKRKQNKQNEIIEISIKNKNISMIDCIINSWDGDKNN